MHATRRARYASPRGPGPGVQLRPPAGRLRRRRVPRNHHPEPRRGHRVRRLLHLGLLQPRRRPARHPLRPAQGRRQARPGPGRQGLAAGRRPGRGARRRTRPAPGPRRHPADAGPAGLRLPVPGRGAGPAGSRGDPRRRAPGPHLLPEQGRGDRPRRLPRPAALGPGGHLVRLRRRRGAPAAAGLVQPLRRGSPGRRGRLHARALPQGPEAAPRTADLGGTAMAGIRQRRRPALQPPRRLADGDQLRRRAG